MKVRKFLFKTMLALCSLGSIVLVVGVCIFLTSLYQYSQDLPDHKKLKEYEKLIFESKIEAKNYFNKAREKILKDVNKKKENIEKEINDEINKAEKEILDLKNKSPEKIRKIAVETSSDLINQLIGIKVNNSSISAIVEDITRKAN